MDDPPIMLCLDELGYDDIVTEFASWQQLEAIQSGYIEQHISSPKPCEDVQTYLNEHDASGYVQQHSAHDARGFEMHHLLLRMTPAQLVRTTVAVSPLCRREIQQTSIPSLPDRHDSFDGLPDDVSDWTLASLAPSCLNHTSSFAISPSVIPFAPISSAQEPSTLITNHSGPEDNPNCMDEIDGWRNETRVVPWGATAVEMQDVGIGGDLATLYEQYLNPAQQDEQDMSVEDQQTIPSTDLTRTNDVRGVLPTYTTITENTSGLPEPSGVPTASTVRTRGGGGRREKATGKTKGRGGTCKQCHIRFGRDADARRHTLTFHNTTTLRVSCKSCGKSCSRPDALKRHQKNSCGQGKRPGRKPRALQS